MANVLLNATNNSNNNLVFDEILIVLLFLTGIQLPPNGTNYGTNLSDWTQVRICSLDLWPYLLVQKFSQISPYFLPILKVN